MTPPGPARVFGFVAAGAEVAVLLRRTSDKRVMMVRWDLATDDFEIGQWIYGRVYEHECDLSPDGKLFAYTALRYGRPHRPSDRSPVVYSSYTAISRPPYFTALALWGEMGRWVGSTYWHSDTDLRFPTGGARPDLGTLPPGLRVSAEGFDTRLSWEEPAREIKRSRRDARAQEAGILPLWATGKMSPRPQWIDVDHRGRLLFAREGRIFVHDANGERELIDLNPFEFRPLEAPTWATEWPEDDRR